MFYRPFLNLMTIQIARTKKNNNTNNNITLSPSTPKSQINSVRNINSKPLHIQGLIRQTIIIKHNICDESFNLILDCNYKLVSDIFQNLIIANFSKILKLETTKLAYCLRIFDLCMERLHQMPGINANVLNSLLSLLFHSSKRIQNIVASLWTKHLFFVLPSQIFRRSGSDSKNLSLGLILFYFLFFFVFFGKLKNKLYKDEQTEICQWLIETVTYLDLHRKISLYDNTEKDHNKEIIDRENQTTQEKNQQNNNKNSEILLIEVPLEIINKSCKVQLNLNSFSNENNEKNGLFLIESTIKEIQQILSKRISDLLSDQSIVESSFEQFRIMLNTLHLLTTAIMNDTIFNALVTQIFTAFLVLFFFIVCNNIYI